MEHPDHPFTELFEQLGAQVWAGGALTELQATGVTARRRRTGPVLDLLTSRTEELTVRLVRDQVMTLPDAARVLPGHGPETTIGQERAANPFREEWS